MFSVVFFLEVGGRVVMVTDLEKVYAWLFSFATKKDLQKMASFVLNVIETNISECYKPESDRRVTDWMSLFSQRRY